jgi:hypothetical protein
MGNRVRSRLRAWARKLTGHVSLRATGVAALAGAVAVGGAGFAVFGGEMGPHLVAALAGMLGEAALVVLVLDRMSRSQELRDWKFADDIVNHAVAACIVDVMRFCGIWWSPECCRANISRYEEFLGVLQLHVAGLRSNLESLVLRAELQSYQDARVIERRFGWLSNVLSRRPDGDRPAPGFEMIADTVRRAEGLVGSSQDLELGHGMRSARRIRAAAGPIDYPASSPAAADRFWAVRMSAQAEFLRQARTEEYGMTSTRNSP